LEQKYYKIHNTNFYILEKITGEVDLQEVIEEIEEAVPSQFLDGIESVILSAYPPTGRSVEGNTIYIKNDFYCEELLVEEIILSIGDYIYNNLIDENMEDISKYFLFKRVRLFDEYNNRFNNKVSLNEFIGIEEEKNYVKNLNNIDFEDMILLTQKYFGNYEASLSLKNYISNSFHLYVTESLNKKYDKKITKLFNNLKEENL
jgi:hypothetical protein